MKPIIHPLLLLLCLLLLFACTAAPTPVISHSSPTQAPASDVSTATVMLLVAAAVSPAASGSTPAVPNPSMTPDLTLDTPATPTQPPDKPRTKVTDAPPTPTRPVPTPTVPLPTATPAFPAVVWGELGEPLVLPFFWGEWSPTANELAGFYGVPTGDSIQEANDFIERSFGDNRYRLAVTRAPDFELRLVDQYLSFAMQVVWSPDGRQVVFSGPVERDLSPEAPEDSTPWVFDHNGQNPRRLIRSLSSDDSYFSIMQFLGWMDDRRLLVTHYQGGGEHIVYSVDLWSGESIGQMAVRGAVFPSNGQLTPFLYVDATYRLLVHTQEVQPEEWQSRLPEGGGPFSRFYPEERIFELNGVERVRNRIFKTWVPGTQRLILFEYVSDRLPKDPDQLLQSSIREWDLSTNTARPLAPNGVDAFASADGKLLAITTLGQAPLQANGAFVPDVPFPTDANPQPFLNLMDLTSEQIVLQVPVSSTVSTPAAFDLDEGQFNYKTSASFSPDSRYLAFLSPGDLQIDASSGVVSVWQAGPSQLHILDLESRQIIFVTPAKWLASWSPKSDRLVYQMEDGSWYLYDLVQGKDIVVVQSGGKNVNHPQWSFSGSYLSFSLLVSGPDKNGFHVTVQRHQAILTFSER